MMKKYDTPIVEVLKLTNDVITNSGDIDAKGDTPFDYGEFNV